MSPHNQLFINNEYIDAKSGLEPLSIYSPHDESLVASNIQVAGQAEVDAAVAAARAAFKPWSRTPPAERARIMLKFADLIDLHKEKVAEWETKAMGQPISLANMVLGMTSQAYRYYAGWTDKVNGEQVHTDAQGQYRIVQYEPIGVCAGIAAWNGTPVQFAWKTAPAVAAGCTFVFKASEKSPIGALQFGDLVKEAGFPPGVINIISGAGATGAMLASHMDINKISFTGSGFTGKKIQELAAKSNLKRVVLELGGKSASLVFPDADLDNVLRHQSESFLVNSGQVCVAASRVLVHEDIADAFVTQLKARFEQFSHTLGEPMNPKTFLGPLADGKQFERVMSFLEIGRSEATLVTGGARKGDKGYYVEPTIFLNPGNDARIYREEIFGPVLTIRTFKTEEEAIELANATSYGLSSCIYTKDVARVLRVARELEAGTVSVNSSQTLGVEAPFGGYKQSGLGRELGKQGIMHFYETKTISINMNV